MKEKIPKKKLTSDFGKILFERRKELGLTQKDVADKVGVKANYISYLEKNLRRPSPKIIKSLADCLKVHPGYLYLAAYPFVREILPIDEKALKRPKAGKR